MYNKKVLKHFKNPHNFGKIPNADGEGKVGNIICLLGTQNVHTINGLKKIKNISKKDAVLSHNGQYYAPTRTVKRNYTGKILTIKNQLGSISLTPEHLILAIKIPKDNKFLRTKNRKELTRAWYHAEQLKKGDLILYPVLKTKKNLKYIRIQEPKSKWDFKSKKIPSKIPINSKSLRLFGYFLSKGNIQDKPCSTFITFTLNIKENEIVEDIKKICKELFNLDVIIRKIPKRNTVVVSLYSARLARCFKRLFDNGAKNKTIPSSIMDLPPLKQKPLIYALWKGDGYINLNREGPRSEYSTISFNLAQQIKTLLLRQKIAPSIYTEKAKEIKGIKHKKTYRIHVGQRDSLIKLCAILNIKYRPQSYPSESAWFNNDYFHIPITKIWTKNHAEKVYNLEVKNSHSFTSDAFCLHNCGDVMQLYIKINKNKKGEEIIKDIKFETFGCVAAIATSSIITDIAKGKTVTEAIKLNKDNIVDTLEELPPVKIHCSVLAIDALQEAIYDYLSKNKKPIPKELQKRHQRIENEKKMIEKKYADWIE